MILLYSGQRLKKYISHNSNPGGQSNELTSSMPYQYMVLTHQRPQQAAVFSDQVTYKMHFSLALSCFLHTWTSLLHLFNEVKNT